MQEPVGEQLPDLERRCSRELGRGRRPEGERPQQQVTREVLHREQGDVEQQQGPRGGRHRSRHWRILAQSSGEDLRRRVRCAALRRGGFIMRSLRFTGSFLGALLVLAGTVAAGADAASGNCHCRVREPGVRALHAGAGGAGADRAGALRNAAGAGRSIQREWPQDRTRDRLGAEHGEDPGQGSGRHAGRGTGPVCARSISTRLPRVSRNSAPASRAARGPARRRPLESTAMSRDVERRGVTTSRYRGCR